MCYYKPMTTAGCPPSNGAQLCPDGYSWTTFGASGCKTNAKQLTADQAIMNGDVFCGFKVDVNVPNVIYGQRNNKEIVGVVKMEQIIGTTNARLCVDNNGSIEYYNNVSFVGVPASFVMDINATVDIYSDLFKSATSLKLTW